MLFSLEALKAEHGDCLLLHWGTSSAPRRLLIDGGPPGVYRDTLRPRLMQLRARGPVGRSGRLALAAVVVSHAHPDHTVGVLELFRELRRAREQRRNARLTGAHDRAPAAGNRLSRRALARVAQRRRHTAYSLYAR